MLQKILAFFEELQMWHMPPAFLEELPVGLIEDQV